MADTVIEDKNSIYKSLSGSLKDVKSFLEGTKELHPINEGMKKWEKLSEDK